MYPLYGQLGPIGYSRTPWYDVALDQLLGYSPIALYSPWHMDGLALNSSVASWPDQSGNNYHAVQATGTAKPFYQLGADGYPELIFDGGDWLVSPLITNSIYYTIIAVVEYASANNSAQVCINNGTASNGYGLDVRPVTGITRRGVINNGITFSHDGSYTLARELWTATRVANGYTRFYVNGALQSELLNATQVPATPKNYTSIGARYTGSVITSSFIGALRASTIFPTYLSDPDRIAVQSLIAQLSGVTL